MELLCEEDEEAGTQKQVSHCPEGREMCDQNTGEREQEAGDRGRFGGGDSSCQKEGSRTDL